jgi:chitinase
MKKHPFRDLASFVLITGFCLFVGPLLVSAAQVTLQWDAGNPSPDGYRLFQSNTSQLYDYDNPVWSGSGTQCTIILEPDQTYYFVVRAYQGVDESGNSNEVSLSANSDSGVDQNTGPDKPIAYQPENGAVVDMTPELLTGSFSDTDGNGHAATRYQIATTFDFSALVLDYTSSMYLTDLPVMDLILDPDTTYYWRARFIDDCNRSSAWSDPFSFTTIDYAAAGDANGNGILDDQEITAYVDLDLDGQDDRTQAGMVSLQTPDAINPRIAVKRLSEGVRIAAVKAHGNQNLDLAMNQPGKMTGLLSFKLYLDEGVTSASVAVYFSQPAPAGAKWYKYDPEAGWGVFPHAVFSSDRRHIRLLLEDGGPGDLDGVRNGIIVDPSGLALDSTQGVDSSSTGPGAGAGCYITTLDGNCGMTLTTGVVVTFLALLLLAADIKRIVGCRWKNRRL